MMDWWNCWAARPTKGIGFAIGTDRLILVAARKRAKAQAATGCDVYLAWFGAAAQTRGDRAGAKDCARRASAWNCRAVEMKFGKSLGLADRLGARYAVILGEDELAAGSHGEDAGRRHADRNLTEAELLRTFA